jgi:Growth-Arrest-Specific Protein 2 Domain
MALPNPTVLSAATQFRPKSLRNQSRSPARSRSPVRRDEFIAKELDPILGNLSPDTILRALQSTDTIADSSAEDAVLARSIAEASPAERVLGIKAAVAAQKLRQWHTEVDQWLWPSSTAPTGQGFLQPETKEEDNHKNPLSSHGYAGSLPTSVAIEYEDRIEEMYDGLNALDVEELKNAVLDSHSSFRLSPKADISEGQDSRDWTHSKIKDFTALITATIIHMLPDLANLNMLLSSWDVRLTILRQIPQLLENLNSTEKGLQAAADVIAGPKTGPLVTKDEVDTTEDFLAGQVSALGTQYDQMLDLLEGNNDSLPPNWIDRLEEIENDFAHFVVDAKRRVMQNEWLAQSKHLEGAMQTPLPQATPERRGVDDGAEERPSSPRRFPSLHAMEDRLEADATDWPAVPALPAYESPVRSRDVDEDVKTDREQTPLTSQGDQPFLFPPTSSRGPSRNNSQRIPSRNTSNRGPSRNASQRNTRGLTLDRPRSGHRREVSEVSLADSQYSTMSGISNAEIVDARSTQVLASPKVQLVDNPFRANRDDLGNYTDKAQPRVRSMHIMGRDAYTRVGGNPNHNRAKSLSIDGPPPKYDPSESPPSLPTGLGDFSPVIDSPTSDTFGDSPSRPTNLNRASTASVEMLSKGQARQISLAPPTSRDSSQLLEYFETRSRSDTVNTVSSDELMAPGTGRGANTGSSHGANEVDDQDETGSAISPVQLHEDHRDSFLDEPPSSKYDTGVSDGDRLAPEGSLEAKIQSILTTLPTRIRLARESDDSDSAANPSSTVSTRSSTPAPFTLSPVKPDRSARGAVNDAGVKVYHLRRNGQSKETKPTKLFVRRVGDEGRVMVRVGGGWADLGEYLREYSLHHGRLSIANGRFEVANLPSSGQRDVPDVPAVPTSLTNEVLSPSSTQSQGFDFGTLLSIPKNPQNFAPDFSRPSANDYATLSWSPEPLLPASHTTFGPTMTTTNANGSVSSTVEYPAHSANLPHTRTTVPDIRGPITTSSATWPIVSTTSTLISSPAAPGPNYTPLGAAGPKNASRRVTTHATTSTPENEAWVDSLVGKARAVSGGPRLSMPQTVTTTATSTPLSRRGSGHMLNSSPMSVQSNSSHISQAPDKVPTLTADKDLQTGRRESGGVSGIRRVFLRKKTKQ